MPVKTENAFPSDWGPNRAGMTLRDWFAGQVLTNSHVFSTPETAADHAYKVADEMMKRRKK